MAILLGPVLGFRGVDQAGWRVSVLLVTDGAAPKVTIGQPTKIAPTAARKIGQSKERIAWRADIVVPQKPNAPTNVTYSVGGMKQTFSFTVPGQTTTPRMAYGSCNGFSDPKAMKSVDENNHLWNVLFQRHGAQPYHLMLLGGDQIYADSLWTMIPAMGKWAELPFKDGNKAAFTPTMRADLDAFYFDLYCSRWSQSQPADVLASIPSIMMWDDHDVIDGWGSYTPARQNSPVFKGLFEIARKHFVTFQLHGSPADQAPSPFISPETGFSFGHTFDKLGVLAVDMRSERSQDQVLSRESWDLVLQWLDNQRGLEHLLIMSSIPVVHPSFTLLESLLGVIPGNQDIEDDLKDHWSSRSHQAERVRFVYRLLKFAADKGTRVTILSGDVHIAALGIIESRRGGAAIDNSQVINQLTSSGIVHPAPPALVAFALERLFDNTEELDRGITASMVRFPGTQKRFLAGRNWLSLEPDPPDGLGRIWANWFAEGGDEKVPYTKVIHPVTAAPP